MNNPSPQNMEVELIRLTHQFLKESGIVYQKEIKLNVLITQHLNIDSLGRAELFRRIAEKFAVDIPDQLLAQAETLQDILNFLETARPSNRKIMDRHIITSHGERPFIDPSATQTLVDVLLLYGEKAPDKTHIYFQREEGGEEMITYGQMLDHSLRVAQGLRAYGLKEGETVAIMQPTHPDFFYTFFGTLLAGGIPVPIYPPFRAHLLEAYAKTEAKILNSAQVRILVTFTQAEKLSRLLQGFVPSLNVVTTVNELMQPEKMTPFFKAKAEHFAFIQYTSGSTSDPKGVLLSHYNLLSNIRAYGQSVQIKPDDVAVSWLPLYHDMGLIGMWLGSLYFGIPLILMTPFSFLNHPERWLWAIHHHRGTHSGAPNFAYELCVRKIEPPMIEGLDLSSWRMAANGAEKVYPRTLEQFADKFAAYGFKRNALLPVYGLAESTVGLCIPPAGREFRIDRVDRKKFEAERAATPSTAKNTLEFVGCGFPIVGHEVRIMDDDNHVLPERRVGTLQFRGPSNMQGYYNNPKATQAIYHDGWINSGDLAYIADKEIFITGRCKDLIIKAGRNLYPVEIEELVGRVAGVRQGCVAVFGVPDERNSTEQLIVVAETREENKLQREKIIAQIKEMIATILEIIPDHVVLVAPRTVPKTSSGKLQRAACKKMYLAGQLSKWSMPPWLQITKLGLQFIVNKSLRFIKKLSKIIYTTYILFLFAISFLPLYFIVRFSKEALAIKTCRLWAQWLQRFALCPLKKIGLENLDFSSAVIFTANHASYIDIIVLLGMLPLNTRFVGKKELFATPLLRTFVQKLKVISIDRIDLSKGLEDTKCIEDALKAGYPVLIFPEGTFSYAEGLRPFRLGAFKVAAETNTPVCPIALQGTRTVLRDDERLLRPNKIQVMVCKSIHPVGAKWQEIIQLRDNVRAEIAKYCGEPSLDFIVAQTIAPKPPK